MDESQIRSWLQRWLPVARKRLGLSQEKLSRRADIGIGTVREIEQNGRLPELESFLRLITALGDQAVADLVNQLREWREASGQEQGKNGDAPLPMPEVKRIKLKPANPKSAGGGGRSGRAREA